MHEIRARKGSVVAATAVLIAFLLTTFTAHAATTLRVAHSSNPGQSTHIYWDELAKRVNERAGGQLELKVFPSGQLGGDEQITRSLKAGTISMGSVASSNLGIVTDAYFFGDLPYVGRVFRTDSEQDNRSELLIFITPRIVNSR